MSADYVEQIKRLEAEIESRRQRVGEMEMNLHTQNQHLAANAIGVAIGQVDETGLVAVRDTNKRNLDAARRALKQVEAQAEAVKKEYAEVEVKDYTERGRKAAHIIIGGHAEALDYLDAVIAYVEKCNQASEGLPTQAIQLETRHRAHVYQPFTMLSIQANGLYRLREQITTAVATARTGLNVT